MNKIFNESYDINSFSTSQNESHNSEFGKFDYDHKVSEIFKPTTGRDKLIISVIDSGIGIKSRDRVKLFKLFGTLQNTR